MVYVVLFGEEAVDVDAHRTAAVQHRRRQPRLTAALDYLLQTLLETVCFRTIHSRVGQESKATHRRLNFADALEVPQCIELLRQVFRELDLTFDCSCVTFSAHELDRHPELQ